MQNVNEPSELLDKTNESKTPDFGPFLTIFGHFCPMRPFSKKSGSVTHLTIYEPLTPCYVSEKTHEPIVRKVKDSQKVRQDGRKGRQKDIQTDPIL